MKTEKLSANMVHFACPDSLLEKINTYRIALRDGPRIPTEAEVIRALLTAGLEAKQNVPA